MSKKIKIIIPDGTEKEVNAIMHCYDLYHQKEDIDERAVVENTDFGSGWYYIGSWWQYFEKINGKATRLAYANANNAFYYCETRFQYKTREEITKMINMRAFQ